MKKGIIRAFVILLFIISGHITMANGLSVAKTDTGSVKSSISWVNKSYGEAFAKKDSALLLNCYTADACIMAANSPILSGKTGILSFFKFAYKVGVRNVVFTTQGLFGLTDQYVTEQGNYEMFDANNTSLGKGKYLVLWMKTPDGWKMHRDMFNSDAPPMQAPK
jgi:ketosteroid isomerase-like protein